MAVKRLIVFNDPCSIRYPLEPVELPELLLATQAGMERRDSCRSATFRNGARADV